MFPTFYQGPPSWFAAHKEIFSAENSISLQKSIIIIIIAAKKRQRMESFVRMTLGRRQVNFVQAVIPLHTSSPSSSSSSSSSLASLSISYHHQHTLHNYHCHTHHYHRHRRRHCQHQDLVARRKSLVESNMGFDCYWNL